MGLDMCIEKIPRIGATPDECNAYTNWREYQDEYLAEPLSDWQDEKCSFEEYSPYSAKHLPSDEMKVALAEYYETKYYSWDTNKEYPHKSVIDMMCSWRKANAIHKWFVDKVQNGKDDCQYHNEVTKDNLLELYTICKAIKGVVGTGYEDKIASKLLPTKDGNFFGSCEYDDRYYYNIECTMEFIDHILENTDFEKEALYYCSSW